MAKLFHNEDLKRLEWLDEHYYMKADGTYYPSVTTILAIYPKGYGYNEWLKSVGFNAEIVLAKAQAKGSLIHNAIDMFLKGEQIIWNDEIYDKESWQMICNFMDFYENFKPEIINNELQLISDVHKIGGTIDIICKLNDKVYVIDIKTGNNIWKEHELQIASYAVMWNEAVKDLDFPQVTQTGILHLNASTRGRDRQNKAIQGKGWQLKTFDRPFKDTFKIFQHIQAVWNEENPNPKPYNLILPDRFKIGTES